MSHRSLASDSELPCPPCAGPVPLFPFEFMPRNSSTVSALCAQPTGT